MAKIEVSGKNQQPESRIPVLSPAPLRRSGSLRLGACPPIKEHHSDVNLRTKLNRHRSLQSLNTSSFVYDQDDDVDSVKSFSSTASISSSLSQCDHAHFAHNGTTYSGRCKRYVVHCSPHSSETDDYLTPTQRTNRTIRKLRSLLKDAQEELIEKDKEILRLTKEAVELRLLKIDSGTELIDIDGDTNQHQVQSDSRLTKSHHLTNSPHLRYCSSPAAQSLTDSGHFEDLNSSKDTSQAAQSQLSQIKTPEFLERQYEDEIRELKEKHSEKVDSLLQRITDVNDRYYALRPLYEDCKEKLHELEKSRAEQKHDSCRTCITKSNELESLKEDLLQANQALLVKINDLKILNTELQLSKSDLNKLKDENEQLKRQKEDLVNSQNSFKHEKSEICQNNGLMTDGGTQTELSNLCNSDSEETKVMQSNYEQNHICSYKAENSELKLQHIGDIEKIKHLEEQLLSDKDIYAQLYKKGIQAAKMLDSKEIENVNQDKDCSLIPDLLQKLRIKQEELDNVKAMYRRLLETRKEQPKHDPEMTLQFLKSAFYYFLTDRENAQGHLSAIESILGFTEIEKINIERAFLWR